MSAANAVLPVVWGFAERAHPVENMDVLRRKGPHALHLVRVEAEAPAEPAARASVAPAPELAFYRKYTEGMLRRYMTMSMEAGRVPSLLGRELFRGHVTGYKVHSFEDVVIYVHDVEKCMATLDKGQQHLLRRIALQGYTQAETAAMLGLTLRTVVRRYAEALDRLTAIFLRLGMLEAGGSGIEQEREKGGVNPCRGGTWGGRLKISGHSRMSRGPAGRFLPKSMKMSRI